MSCLFTLKRRGTCRFYMLHTCTCTYMYECYTCSDHFLACIKCTSGMLQLNTSCCHTFIYCTKSRIVFFDIVGLSCRCYVSINATRCSICTITQAYRWPHAKPRFISCNFFIFHSTQHVSCMSVLVKSKITSLSCFFWFT